MNLTSIARHVYKQQKSTKDGLKSSSVRANIESKKCFHLLSYLEHLFEHQKLSEGLLIVPSNNSKQLFYLIE